MLKIPGRPSFIFYLFLTLPTLALWLLSKPALSLLAQYPLLSLAQLSALLAAVLVGINPFLSSRINRVNRFFGGLDKTLKHHAITGRLAFTLMLAHPILLIINALPSWELTKVYLLPAAPLSYTFGKLALLLFTLLLVLTLLIRIPFHIWRHTHRFMLLPLIFLFLHIATIESDTSRFLPLKLWLLGFLTLGIISHIYKVFLYRFTVHRYHYRVIKVTRKSNITEIILTPLGTPLNFLPGQFVFAIFKSPHVTAEEHPFTISSSPRDPVIRLSVKISGDFTSTLTRLQKGDAAILTGPYGSFTQKALTTKKDVILIGGGIGITPFLSLIKYFSQTRPKKKLTVFCLFRNQKDAVYIPELRKLTVPKKIILHLHSSSRSGRFQAESVIKLTDNPANSIILLCGPKSMIDNFYQKLISLGIPSSNIDYESFNLK